MPKGVSLHIGVNSVDGGHYSGWTGPLTACEYDAEDLKEVASQAGFSPTTLMTAEATRDAVLAEIKKAAGQLESGDIFLLSYSGHGGQLPDDSHDEDDGLDETWCLYDGQLVDDELSAAWSTFKAGVRILVLSDSCHSGTVIRSAAFDSAMSTRSASSQRLTPRAMPQEVAGRVYRSNRTMYKPILAAKPPSSRPRKVSASVLLISGCQDNQLSLDGPFNGAFTGALLRVWQEGTFSGSYKQFHKRIVRRLPPTQSPNLLTAGGPTTAFLAERPFTI